MLRLIRCHEEAVYTVAFTPDSRILLTACSLGNIRLHYLNIDNDNLSTIREAACSIDAAHDLGVLSADISKFIHVDRKCSFIIKSYVHVFMPILPPT